MAVRSPERRKGVGGTDSYPLPVFRVTFLRMSASPTVVYTGWMEFQPSGFSWVQKTDQALSSSLGKLTMVSQYLPMALTISR